MRYRLWALFVCKLCLSSVGSDLPPPLPAYGLAAGLLGRLPAVGAPAPGRPAPHLRRREQEV